MVCVILRVVVVVLTVKVFTVLVVVNAANVVVLTSIDLPMVIVGVAARTVVVTSRRAEVKTVAVKVRVRAVEVVSTSTGVMVTVNGPSPNCPRGSATRRSRARAAMLAVTDSERRNGLPLLKGAAVTGLNVQRARCVVVVRTLVLVVMTSVKVTSSVLVTVFRFNLVVRI